MPNEETENQIVILTVPKDSTLPIEATVSGSPLLEKFEACATDDRSGIKKIDSATGTHSVFAIDRTILEVGVRKKDEPQQRSTPNAPLLVYPMTGEALDPKLLFADPPIGLPRERRHTTFYITGDDAIVDTTDYELAHKLIGDYMCTREKRKYWTLIGIDGRGGCQTRWRFRGHRLLLKTFSVRMDTTIDLEMAKEK